MGNVGASKQRAELEWDERTLFVRPLSVNRVAMYLTSAGRQTDAALDDDIRRVLA
jgi:hypothetical protein